MKSIATTLALAFAACATPAVPETRFAVNDEGIPHVLGARLSVRAGWESTCVNWSAVLENAVSSNESHLGEHVACKGKPFQLQIACSSPCLHDGQPISPGAIAVTVIPQTLGPLTITAILRRIENGETSQQTLPAVMVVLPDWLELRCRVQNTTRIDAPCGPEGVPAEPPQLMPVVHVGDHTETSTALTVNGKPVPGAEGEAFSLVDVFPEARDGDGIKPGTYVVTLSIGQVSSTWQVVAR